MIERIFYTISASTNNKKESLSYITEYDCGEPYTDYGIDINNQWVNPQNITDGWSEQDPELNMLLDYIKDFFDNEDIMNDFLCDITEKDIGNVFPYITIPNNNIYVEIEIDDIEVE